MSDNSPDKPGWGATIGVWFLCGCLTITACVFTSAALVSGMGFSGYSSGGLMSTVTAIGCAAAYRSTGKLAGPVIAALVIGVVIGFFAVQLAKSAAGM